MKDEKTIIANWKMKLSLEETLMLAKKMKEKFLKFEGATIGICPNFLSLNEVGRLLDGTNIKLGAQNVFWEATGAYTGEVSAKMLLEAGCQYVIVGHSERRKFLMENYEMIHKKIKAVFSVDGLIPVVCIGENWVERKTDRRDFVLFDQLQQSLSGLDILSNQQLIIAYEPIWAIGSGMAIEPEEAEYAHKIIKLTLNDIFGLKTVRENIKIIYGGSINSQNVKGFVGLENLDGMLVGGSSLDVDEFYNVVTALIK
jgi:triosephosphate isomerase (TIM)